MVNWEDGTKVSNAYVDENNEIVDAVYEGDTPLCADNLNLMQKIDIGTVTIAKNTTITNGYQVTLPVQYQVGNNSLELRLNSEVLKLATDTEDGHYKEVRNCRNTK